MKPAPFQYAAPTSIDETLALLRLHGTDGKVLAGGQSLVPLLNMRLARPSVLIDLNHVAGLDYIKEEKHQLVIGAMTRQRTAELSALVWRKLPLLAEALRHVGHPQIRNRGTIGGSLAHADPSAELPAVVSVLEGTLVIRGPKGSRQLTTAEFFRSYLTTALAPEELLTEVRLPKHDRAGTAFVEVARRHGDYALVGVAALVSLNGYRVKEARMSFTGVGPVPIRLAEAEAMLGGAKLDDRALADLSGLVSARLDPESDVHASAAYRKQVAGALAVRALRLAVRRAEVGTQGRGTMGPQ